MKSQKEPSMDDIERLQNLDQGVMTVRQQVEYLLACVRRRELEKQERTNNLSETCEQSEDDCIREYAEKIPDYDANITESVNPQEGKSACKTNLGTLDTINEEPSSTLDYVRDGEREDYHGRKSEDFPDDKSNSSECTSSCSCCRDTTNYLSTSVSIVAEETIYSPQKKEFSRSVHCTKIDQSSWECSRADDEEETLEPLLQNRLRELEAEIDVFKTENAHVSKLRKDYEKEYNLFCKERVELLAKVREEHLSNVKDLEEEKKKLQCEKRAFDRYMREAKNRPNKQEKEEIRLLKEEVRLLKEEMNKKESRWAAAQARIRTEMKMLKDRNSTLQEELKELKKTPKKVTFAPVMKRSKSFSSVKTKPDLSKETTNNAKKSTASPSNSLLDSRLNEPPTSDSGFFSDTLPSLSESISESLRRSICLNSYLNDDTEKDDTSDKISASALPSEDSGNAEVSESTDSSGNHEKLYSDGRKEIWCANGSVKKISSDGKITKTIFYNGDVEEISVDENVIKYYHAASQTWHSKFGDGLEIKEFPNGQIEKYCKDGSTEIVSPDGTVFITNSSGEKRWNLKDGTVVLMNERTQEKRIIYINGQIEIHTPEFKRREYPDGTVRTVFNGSGMQETKYPNGRIRLKSHDGALISDTKTT